MAEENISVDSVAPSKTDGEVIDLEDLVRDLGSTAPVVNETIPALAASPNRKESAAPQPEDSEIPAGRVDGSVDRPTDQAIAKPADKPVDSSAGGPEAAPSPSANSAFAAQSSEMSPDIDAILAVEAPDLMAEIDEMRSSNTLSGGESIDSENLAQVRVPKGVRARIRERVLILDLKLRAFLRSFRDGVRRLVKDSKGFFLDLARDVLAWLIVSVKSGRVIWVERIQRFFSLTLQQKIAYLASVLILSLAATTGYLTYEGRLLPPAKREWVASFADIADGVFTYEDAAGFEDFNDPLHHPEFVVLFDRVVVNLTRTAGASPEARPMAALELYIQTDNQDAAIELKDRKVEIQDSIARAVEQLTYPVLSTEEGKSKLKLLIRKDVNEKLTKGRVRRVYFKTIVLNPEES